MVTPVSSPSSRYWVQASWVQGTRLHRATQVHHLSERQSHHRRLQHQAALLRQGKPKSTVTLHFFRFFFFSTFNLFNSFHKIWSTTAWKTSTGTPLAPWLTFKPTHHNLEIQHLILDLKNWYYSYCYSKSRFMGIFRVSSSRFVTYFWVEQDWQAEHNVRSIWRIWFEHWM